MSAAARGFLSYLGLAIRLELNRPNLEFAAGSREGANAAILKTLSQFKEARSKAK